MEDELLYALGLQVEEDFEALDDQVEEDEEYADGLQVEEDLGVELEEEATQAEELELYARVHVEDDSATQEDDVDEGTQEEVELPVPQAFEP